MSYVKEKYMELKETIKDMTSEDYKERFRAEYNQVFIRRKKLSDMLDKWGQGELKFEPKCSFYILSTQMAIMSAYILILRERARIENIEL